MKLARRHKTLVHLFVIGAIALSMIHEGGGTADWLFVGLSVLCEVN